MAKIGTAHLEIKPVVNDEALAQITAAIEKAVAAGVEAGMVASRAFAATAAARQQIEITCAKTTSAAEFIQRVKVKRPPLESSRDYKAGWHDGQRGTDDDPAAD